MMRHAASLALLDASEQQIRDALVTWHAIALAAVDALAEQTARVQQLERQLAETRDELRRYARERVA